MEAPALAGRLMLRRLFGFLLGSTLAGASVYYYILEEYKVSNEMLTEDIYVRGLRPQLFTPPHHTLFLRCQTTTYALQ